MHPKRGRLRISREGENGGTTLLPGGGATASNSIGKKKLRQRIVKKDGTLVPSEAFRKGARSFWPDHAAVNSNGAPLVITSVCS